MGLLSGHIRQWVATLARSLLLLSLALSVLWQIIAIRIDAFVEDLAEDLHNMPPIREGAMPPFGPILRGVHRAQTSSARLVRVNRGLARAHANLASQLDHLLQAWLKRL